MFERRFQKTDVFAPAKNERLVEREGPDKPLTLDQVVKLAEEKNKSLVMLSRLKNREIQEQLRSTAEQYPNLFLKKPDEILAAINEAIYREMSVTHIMPNKNVMSSYYNRLTEKAQIGTRGDFSKIIREYVEAHEKDHAVRAHLLNTAFGVSGDMSKGFSLWSYIKNKGKQFLVKGIWGLNVTSLLGPAAGASYLIASMIQPSYMHSSWEIYARMSQLKNYFGFEGDEKFTKEHLEYAREHFVKDTGIDNNMTEFFNSISPRSEKHFLHIMNNFGV